MIVESTITLGCDHEGCEAEFEAPALDVWEARRLARNVGWTHRLKPDRGFSRPVDFCPTHADQHDHDTVRTVPGL